jgi:hypothetical protein
MRHAYCYPCAVVFAKDKNVRYFVKSDELPNYLDVKAGSRCPDNRLVTGLAPA